MTDTRPGGLEGEPGRGAPDGAVSLVEALCRRGVDLIFSHAMPPGVRRAALACGMAELPCRTGEAAVAMAYGHACARGRAGVERAGVALAGGELAVAELVAPLAAALGAEVPLLALVQPVSAGAVATRALLAGAVRAFGMIADAGAVEPSLEAAFATLEGSHPGPVALMLAPDLFFAVTGPPPPDPVTPVCHFHPAPYPASHPAPPPVGAPTPIALTRLLAELALALGPQGILVSEDEHGFDVPVLPHGAGGGFGCCRTVCPSRALPVALGARLAAPSTPVACLVGPGLRAGWADLQTAQQMHLPLVLVVCNPAGAAGIDHAAIAAACGCIGIRVDHAEEVPAALHAALAADRPTVVDVLTEA